MRTKLIVLALAFSSLPLSALLVRARVRADSPAYVAYYWRAKPDQKAAYDDYIRTVAAPIDEDARKAGAFEEVHTVTPAPGVTADWTHLRIFRVKDPEAAKALGAALDAATARIVPDPAQRKANTERAAGLRDFVRQEVWTELK